MRLPSLLREVHDRSEGSLPVEDMSEDQDWLPLYCGVSEDFSSYSEALPFRKKGCHEVR